MSESETQERRPKHGSLGLAIVHNDVDDAKLIVEILAERKQYIDTEEWTSMLFKTLGTMKPATAAFLRESGADIEASISMDDGTGRQRVLSLGYACIATNNKELLTWMIGEGWVDEKMLSPAGDTLLVQAIREHAFDIADLLVERGMSIDYQNLRGVGPMHEAAANGDYMALEWLMKNNANPTLETIAGAVPCELVPDDAEDMAEADQLFEAIDGYMREYKDNGRAQVPHFIASQAKKMRKARGLDDENAPKPDEKPRRKVSISM